LSLIALPLVIVIYRSQVQLPLKYHDILANIIFKEYHMSLLLLEVWGEGYA